MRNFYYVVSFNLTNPRVKTMLARQKVTDMTGTMIDFKLRSKLFLTYPDAVTGVHEDFDKKLQVIYDDKEEHQVNQFSVANPLILGVDPEMMATLSEKYGGNFLNDWDETCCSVMFFADNPDEESEIVTHPNPNAWMFKYEIMFMEDAIELSGNGDFVFSPINVPHNSFTSSYH